MGKPNPDTPRHGRTAAGEPQGPAERGGTPCVAVVGGGPAGLMAAEVLSQLGARVELYDAMPSCGRKFLLAGRGGLNLTHSEPFEAFATRYAGARASLEPLLHRFGPTEVRQWALGLGVPTFVGSSGRVFPSDLKAAPLLRAWLHRLRARGVAFHMRHCWLGWGEAAPGQRAPGLRLQAPHGSIHVRADAVVLALGGGSWARLGSNGAWLSLLAERGVDVAPLRPSNCGFDVSRALPGGGWAGGWSPWFVDRFAGQPLKTVALAWTDPGGGPHHRRGEFVVTRTGVEGSLIYALSASARDAIEARGATELRLDLLPAHTPEQVAREVQRPRGTRTLSTHLKSRLGLAGVKAALLRELLAPDALADPARLAQALKALPLRLVAPRPLDEAISSAGGVRFEAMDEQLMLRSVPGVFCAGEMLDWEAPTGGYLLTAALACGVAAAQGVWAYVRGAPH
jgi:uncharacterized flavoprotein (TIGR03862 family)